MPRIHVTAILFLAAAVWAGMLVLDGAQLTPDLAKPWTTVCGIVVGAISAFELFLWRLRVFQGWFVKRPYLQGTWAVTLIPDWIDPETKVPRGPIQAYLAVTQTYTTITLRLMTKESESKLVGSSIVREADGTYVVSAVYLNVPKPEFRHRSEIHFGALMMNVHGQPAASLSGSYWTDRKSKGQMHSTGRTKSVLDTFESASLATFARK